MPQYCRTGADFADRLFQETKLIGFSDPNDLSSYPIPTPSCATTAIPRQCPKQFNVTINIAPVTSVLGFAEFANPAHVDYDDERVIGLITRGIGQTDTAPGVKERCTWLEVAEDLR